MSGFSAEALFDASIRLMRLDDELWEFLEGILGVETLPCSDITYDYYDASFEFKDVPDDWRWPLDKFEPVWQAGFGRFWLNHLDGTETYYSKTGTLEGWRRPSLLAKGEGTL